MSLPANITPVAVSSASFTGPAGTGWTGIVIFAPSAFLVDETGFGFIGGTEVGELAGGVMAPLDLVPTDCPNVVPTPFTYTVTVRVQTTGGSGYDMVFAGVTIPAALGPSCDLSQILPPGSPGTTGEVYLPLSGGVMTGPVAPRDVPLADAATVTPIPGAAGNDFTLQLTSAVGSTRQVAAAAPFADCQTVRFLFVQPPSGGPCGVTWATGANGYDFGSAGAPTLSQGASQGDIAGFQSRVINGVRKWRYLGDQGDYS